MVGRNPHAWEPVVTTSPNQVRRLSVLGGWLYQVASHVSPLDGAITYHPPVFVEDWEDSTEGG